MADELLRERYARVLEGIDQACRAAGRSRSEVRLVAVSKLHPYALVGEAAGLGQTDFGESYVQEALQKRQDLAADPALAPLAENIRWHMIGHVQSRKAALVAGAFCLVHSLDSRKLADALEKALSRPDTGRGQRQGVLLEVNVGQEPQKAGVMCEDLAPLADHVREHCPHLEMQGLMCLPPVFDAGDAARPYFARLRELRDGLRARLGLPLPELSMGMSGDFAAAVAEGATLVRIGTDIFGQRPAKG